MIQISERMQIKRIFFPRCHSLKTSFVDMVLGDFLVLFCSFFLNFETSIQKEGPKALIWKPFGWELFIQRPVYAVVISSDQIFILWKNSSCCLERTTECTAGSAKSSFLPVLGQLWSAAADSPGVTLSLELFCILSVITRPAASQLRRTHNQAGRRDVSRSRETLVPFFIPKILAGEELCVSLQPGLFPKRNLSYSKWWNHLFVQRLPGTFLYNGSLSVK